METRRTYRILITLLIALYSTALHAQTIPADFFGMHVGVSHGYATPILAPVVVHAQGKPVVTAWQYLETARGTYNFSALDSAMSSFAQPHGVPIFWSHHEIPKWATSDVSTCSPAAISGIFNCTAPPSDMTTSAPCQGSLTGTTTTDCMWKEFLTTFANRYKPTGIQTGCSSGNPQCNGIVQMYEGWNEPPDSPAILASDLVTFEADFLSTVKAVDTTIQVGSPAFILDPAHVSFYMGFLEDFLTDWQAIHPSLSFDTYDFHSDSANPEDQITLINQFKAKLAAHGLGSKTIYATEGGAWFADNCITSPADDAQQAYIGRIEPIYWSLGIKRHYWYAYDSCGTLTNQPSSSTLKPAGIAYGTVEGWMVGSTMSSGCAISTGTVWTCGLTTALGLSELIVWNSAGTSSYTIPTNYDRYTDIAGTPHPVSPGSNITISTSPVLISGAVYYVSFSTGSNSNSGLDPAHPWQTLPKVNSPGVTYAPGDSILFRCGDTWTSASLTTPRPGSSGLQITYSNYSTSPACSSSTLPTLDGSGGSTIIRISNNFITINGLQLQNATSSLIDFTGASNWQITNNIGKNASLRAFYGAVGTGTGILSGNTYTVDPGHSSTNNIFHVQSTALITMTNNSSDLRNAGVTGAINFTIFGGAPGSSIDHNIAHGGAQGFSFKPYVGAGGKCQPGDPAVTGVFITDNWAELISGEYPSRSCTTGCSDGEGIELEGCSPDGGPLNQSNVTTARNIIICKPGGAHVGTTDAIGSFFSSNDTISGNIAIGDCGYYDSGFGGSFSTSPRIFSFSSSSHNQLIYNNTVVGVGRITPVPVRGIAVLSNGSGTYKNNIMSNLAVGFASDSGSTGTEGTNVFDTNVGQQTTGTFTHLGGNIVGLPQFAVVPVVDANSVKLLTGSPAINSGLVLGLAYQSILSPNNTAPNYTSFTQGPLWMIGAFGFNSTVIKSITGAKISGAIIP